MKLEPMDISVTFAGIGGPARVPGWARAEFDAKPALIQDLTHGSSPLAVSVLRSRNLKRFLHDKEVYEPVLRKLVEDQGKHFRVVLSFTKTEEADTLGIAQALGNVAGGIPAMDLSFGEDDLRSSLKEAMAKLLATRFDDKMGAQPDPLGEIKRIADTGKSLRAASGRLDAKKTASVFGISRAELARQIGLNNRQTLHKTPDSETLQPLLRPYERIARLRAILSDEAFRAWLNTPNEHLEDGDPPMEYLKHGASAQLADFAENMLTGASA